MAETSLDILNRYWGYTFFRPSQSDIIDAAIKGENVLAVLPTGGGKSLCFQVPAMMSEGTCLVISPLVSLMKDQIESLKSKGITAYAIYSGLNNREIDAVLDNVAYGKVKFLYVAPERLKSNNFIERLPKFKINYLVVDEAHCISQWGYDFRPSYLDIPSVYQFLKDVPKLAFTASATKDVKEDIINKLQFETVKVFKGDFLRSNLSYAVFKEENKYQKVVDVLSKVEGSAIVYVGTRKKTVEVAKYLFAQKIKVDVYHAGVSIKEREQKQDKWMKNEIRVIVATNAFGMGINKPDVRTVIHYDVPSSLEAFYQEAGRAGRDEKKAYAVALYNEEDISNMYKNLEVSYPSEEYIKRIYQSLSNFLSVAIGNAKHISYDFSFIQFFKRFELNSSESFRAIKLLEKHGFIKLSDAFYEPSKVKFLLDAQELYRFQVSNSMFDDFLKVLMRIYGGTVFDEYQKIDESTISIKSNKNVYDVRSTLIKLAKLGVLHYIMQHDKPQLTFLNYRHDANKLPLNFRGIQQLKLSDTTRLNAMVKFLENEEQCRSYQLAAYFDEYIEQDCGVCDNCF